MAQTGGKTCTTASAPLAGAIWQTQGPAQCWTTASRSAGNLGAVPAQWGTSTVESPCFWPIG
ncbi:hypothetical protein psal_cds_215 [Pandoravirus salinus]|uniref:Uncharacterized protein n=1 Tax=Pandoravirus salinus TaxID=1349410 RepID=S4W058_9VIRU|nr:hypothetical protein psal_cds_215 [Pandoravirus salinus]AGO83742.2 hypothetical protein psal_cds_215 [Pandoravirus salinus]